MKERPILCNGEMVRAILDGRKTQTRRVVTFTDRQCCEVGVGHSGQLHKCHGASAITDKFLFTMYPHRAGVYVPHPHGAVGDRLWVRETFCEPSDCVDYHHKAYNVPVMYAAGEGRECHLLGCNYFQRNIEFKWRPSIHMPRWASRITLEVIGVRAERLQGISEEDAEAEGRYGAGWDEPTSYSVFATLWDSIYGKRQDGKPDISWQANPWVWVTEFERVEGGE